MQEEQKDREADSGRGRRSVLREQQERRKERAAHRIPWNDAHWLRSLHEIMAAHVANT